MTPEPAVQTLTPFRHGMRWPRLVAVGGSTLPACAVACIIGAENGHPLPGAVLTALVLGAFVAVAAIVLRSRVELRPDGLRSRRLTDAHEVRRSDVVKAVFRRIQNRDELSSQRYLFLLDRSGRALLRMSDRWWTAAQMTQVAEHVGAPVETTEEVVYLSELRRSVPEQLHWQERHVVLWVVVRIVAVSAASLLIAALATAAL